MFFIFNFFFMTCQGLVSVCECSFFTSYSDSDSMSLEQESFGSTIFRTSSESDFPNDAPMETYIKKASVGSCSSIRNFFLCVGILMLEALISRGNRLKYLKLIFKRDGINRFYNDFTFISIRSFNGYYIYILII